MQGEVSLARLYVLRAMFFMNFVMLGMSVWPAIFRHEGQWQPMQGVAYSVWAALSLLSGLGLRNPLKMVPLLLMQLTYKLIWMLVVAAPDWASVRGTALVMPMVLGFLFDLVAIPWPYVFKNYMVRGERWR